MMMTILPLYSPSVRPIIVWIASEAKTVGLARPYAWWRRGEEEGAAGVMLQRVAAMQQTSSVFPHLVDEEDAAGRLLEERADLGCRLAHVLLPGGSAEGRGKGSSQPRA